MITDKVNGYRNYSTFATALWFDNDEGLYSEVLAAATDAWDQATTATESKLLDRSGEARYLLKEALKAKLESIQDQEYPQHLGQGLMGDLLGFAIEQIDFYELADKYLCEIGESDYLSRDAARET